MKYSFFDPDVHNTPDKIRERYYEMCKVVHPDGGGDKIAFRSLLEEKERLLASLESPSSSGSTSPLKGVLNNMAEAAAKKGMEKGFDYLQENKESLIGKVLNGLFKRG